MRVSVSVASALVPLLILSACSKGSGDAKPGAIDAAAKLSPLASAIASAPSAPTHAWAKPEMASDCERALHDVCADSLCATAGKARQALANRRGAACFQGDIGPCGDGHFIDFVSSDANLHATFDAKKALVAIEINSGTPRECSFGPKRACTPNVAESFCPPRPLAEHCAGKPCPTLVELVERYHGEGGCAPGSEVERMPCGDFIVVDERTGGGSVTRYFDKKGKLIAALGTNPELGASMRWGAIPQCSTSPGDQLCPPPKAPLKGKKRGR
jgi:hypothetical protein